jgi:hypothetical protein
MNTRTGLSGAGVVVLAVIAGGGVGATAQAPAAVARVLTVANNGKTVTIAAADLKTLPRARAEIKDEGRTVVYEGVLVAEVLKRVDAPLGTAMRGDALTTFVVATATDGYQVVFSLAELDPALSGSEIIVADSADGKPLVEKQGPFRVVVPRDARPTRSVRMLDRLELTRVRK